MPSLDWLDVVTLRDQKFLLHLGSLKKFGIVERLNRVQIVICREVCRDDEAGTSETTLVLHLA